MAEENVSGSMSSRSATGKREPVYRLGRIKTRLEALKKRLEGDITDKHRKQVTRRIKSIEADLAWEAAAHNRLMVIAEEMAELEAEEAAANE